MFFSETTCAMELLHGNIGTEWKIERVIFITYTQSCYMENRKSNFYYIYSVLEMKFGFTCLNQILEFIFYIFLNKN